LFYKAVSTKLPSLDKRQPGFIAPEYVSKKRSLPDLIEPFIRNSGLQDLISAQHHSEDFKETRAGYITLRLRLLVFFYAAAIPLWIPFDYLLLRPEHSASMVLPRILMTVFLLLFGHFTQRALTSIQVHSLLALTFIASGTFYFTTMQILSHGVAEVPLAGYSLMPFLMVSMLGVFPLTLGWGITLIATVMIFFLGLEASQNRLMTADTANMLWMFLMLGGVTLWVQSSHLLMLLRLYREASQDPLTGLINRRVLMKRLTSEIAHLSERKTTFCIMIFDLDRFKRINDSYGHLVGDKVLKATAVILQKGLREHDIIARFGGEEFVAVLPSCKSEDAVVLAERIRATCYGTHFTAPNGDDIQLSTSVGVTEYKSGEEIETTLSRVDEMLYKAKEMGRNRVHS
jgi:diguanylate cyclase (GGDEF)-like protein